MFNQIPNCDVDGCGGVSEIDPEAKPACEGGAPRRRFIFRYTCNKCGKKLRVTWDEGALEPPEKQVASRYFNNIA